MGTSENGHIERWDAAVGQARCYPADFLDRPADEGSGLGSRIARLFSRRIVGCMGAVPDGGHRGEGEHDQRGVAVLSMPGSGCVMIEAEFDLGIFEALDAPALALHPDQRSHGAA